MPDLNSLPPSTRSPPPPPPLSTSASAASASSRQPPSGASGSLGGMSSTNHEGSEPATSPSQSQSQSQSQPQPPSLPSPGRSATTSLQAAAAVNAGLQHHGPRRALLARYLVYDTHSAFVLSADTTTHHRLLQFPLSPGYNLLQSRPPPIPSPHESAAQRPLPPRARRDGPRLPRQRGEPRCHLHIAAHASRRRPPSQSRPESGGVAPGAGG